MTVKDTLPARLVTLQRARRAVAAVSMLLVHFLVMAGGGTFSHFLQLIRSEMMGYMQLDGKSLDIHIIDGNGSHLGRQLCQNS